MDIHVLKQLFTYHPPKKDQIPRYERIRAAALEFGKVILECTPPGPDQSVAIRMLRNAVRDANAAIALEEEAVPVHVESIAAFPRDDVPERAQHGVTHSRAQCRDMFEPGSGCMPGCPYED